MSSTPIVARTSSPVRGHMLSLIREHVEQIPEEAERKVFLGMLEVVEELQGTVPATQVIATHLGCFLEEFLKQHIGDLFDNPGEYASLIAYFRRVLSVEDTDIERDSRDSNYIPCNNPGLDFDYYYSIRANRNMRPLGLPVDCGDVLLIGVLGTTCYCQQLRWSQDQISGEVMDQYWNIMPAAKPMGSSVLDLEVLMKPFEFIKRWIQEIRFN